MLVWYVNTTSPLAKTRFRAVFKRFLVFELRLQVFAVRVQDVDRHSTQFLPFVVNASVKMARFMFLSVIFVTETRKAGEHAAVVHVVIVDDSKGLILAPSRFR
ncbi:hypothetical protein EII22_05710 [Coriobacteriales bacterium OH1046]|nr:hypothetical protein EII22_05710 [Coriobacteriales bacterium OH1046]